MREPDRDFFAVGGGLDQVTAPLLLKPSAMREAMNFEQSSDGGYARIQGYEAYAEFNTPSALNYSTVRIQTGLPVGTYSSIPVEQMVLGVTSGATMLIHGTQSGVVPASLDVTVYCSGVRGQFVVGEDLRLIRPDGRLPSVGTTLGGKILSVPVSVSGGTPREYAQNLKTAQDIRRRNILIPAATAGAVGPILGCARFETLTFVFRAVTTGAVWCFFPMPRGYVSLQETTDPSRTWIADTQWAATGPGVPEPPKATPTAKFEFEEHNFYGDSDRNALYGVSGTGKAFFFGRHGAPGGAIASERRFGAITTGLQVDTPEHLACHAGRLFLSKGASLMYSTSDDPTSFNAVNGAGEFAVGEDITALKSLTGGEAAAALAIFTRSRIYILYGSSSVDFKLVPYSTEIGAQPGTVQRIGTAYFANDFGVSSLSQSDSWGAFSMSQITEQVRPFMRGKRRKAVCSMIVRAKNQYRLFFDDGDALYVTFRDRKIIGMTTVRLDFRPTCCFSGVDLDGQEILLVGSHDGNLYRMDSGNNFNGRPINAWMSLAFNHVKSPRRLKDYRRTILEVKGTDFADFRFGYDLDFMNRQTEVHPDQLATATNNESVWDAGIWDDGYWDGYYLTPSQFDTPGSGQNISIRLMSESDISGSFLLSGVIIEYLLRRGLR